MAYNFKALSVLVVEDNPPMLELTVSILETYGVKTIFTARNGEEGFDKFCKYKPDLVISDWMMKPGDGIELARQIRKHKSSPDPYVPFILMTGFSQERRVFHARDTGITEFLAKPFTARDLYRRIVQVIEKPRQFVRNENFFGPDRRRRNIKDYTGELKRETDIQPDDFKVDM